MANGPAEDFEQEAENAFQRAFTKQHQSDGDFDSEFDISFHDVLGKAEKDSCDSKEINKAAHITGSIVVNRNGSSQLPPVKTEGLPSSLPSSQG